MKFKFLLSTLLLSILFSGATIAQEKNKEGVKKATIVKKIIDENGNETIETIILEGDAVDVHLNQLDLKNGQVEKVEVIKDGDNAHIWITKKGERIELENMEPNKDSESIRIYKFGEGGDPALINEGKIDVEVEHIGGEQIIKITRDGVEKVIKVEDTDENVFEMQDGDHHVIIINTDEDENEASNEQDEIRTFIYEPGKPVANIPFLGIMMNMEVDHDDHGGGDVITTKIITLEPVPNSPAEKAGIQNGDVLMSLDDKLIEDIEDVTSYVKGKEIGNTVIAKIFRGGEELSIPIILGERPGIFPDATNKSTEEYNFRKGNQKRHHHRNRRVERDPCKPFIGFSSSRRHSNDGGLEVLSVIKNTPAKRDGLLPGDFVLEMNGQKIDSHKEILAIRDRHDSGDRFKLLIKRNGKKMKIRSSFDDCPENKDEVETAINIDQEEINEDFNAEFNIFPNPTDGAFTLSYNGQPGTLNISITDITGKQLFEKTMSDYNGDYSEQIDLTDIADGTIIIQIENEGEILIEKLILQTEN